MNRVIARLGIAISIGLVVGAAGGAAAQESTDTTSATPFESSFTYVGQPDPGSDEELTGKVRKTGETWQFLSAGSTDPRLEGELTFTLTQDAYPEVTVFVRAARITNERGAWQEEPSWVIDEDLVPGLTLDQVYLGEGDYDGLILLAKWTWTDSGFDLDGHIIESDLPAVPEPWSEP